MAVEMPDPVAAASGAEVISFPWLAASDAVAALNTAATTLGTQGEGRVLMEPGLTDWRGGYRSEFDLAYSDLMANIAGVSELLLSRAGAIADAATAANELQTARNNSVAV